MAPENDSTESRLPALGAGQVMLRAAEPILAPSDQVRDLYRLSDPGLSELGLDELLDELLTRVQDALRVDTAAILLFEQRYPATAGACGEGNRGGGGAGRPDSDREGLRRPNRR